MKTLFITLFALLASFSLSAANLTLVLSARGKATFIVRTNDAIMTLNDKGEILSLRGDDLDIERYSDFRKYEAGKIKRLAGVNFSYHSDFHSYNSGKIKEIDGRKIEYYSTFNDYESGKIKSINNVQIKYYSTFNDYEAGKIKSIGKQQYKYYSSITGFAGQLQSGNLKFSEGNINFVIRKQ